MGAVTLEPGETPASPSFWQRDAADSFRQARELNSRLPPYYMIFFVDGSKGGDVLDREGEEAKGAFFATIRVLAAAKPIELIVLVMEMASVQSPDEDLSGVDLRTHPKKQDIMAVYMEQRGKPQQFWTAPVNGNELGGWVLEKEAPIGRAFQFIVENHDRTN